MPTNVYFNNQGSPREQMLLEDMVIESIRNHGIDVYYIPRESQSSVDEIYGEDTVKTYTKVYPLDVYLESYNNFEGNEEFFSKFGLEVNKGVTCVIARRTFEKYVPLSLRNVPKEGDLIWFPTQLKLMEIKFVEQEKSFFQLGRPGGARGAVSTVAGAKVGYMYEITCETFKYNGELINTGYSEIDSIADLRAFSVDYTLNTGTGTYSVDEMVYQGASAATANVKGYVSEWNKPSKILRLRNVKGEFVNTAPIIGSTSNASWTMISANTMEDASTLFDDNVRIESEADGILDFTEINPFGEP